jgi:hypothetical protein
MAPKQQFVFAIDSYAEFEDGHSIDDQYVEPVLDVLLKEFPGPVADWPMYGQWAN